MLRHGGRPGARHASAILGVLLTLFLSVSSALGQVPDCPAGLDCSGPAQGDPGPPPTFFPPPTLAPPPNNAPGSSIGGGKALPGAPGKNGSGTNNGANGRDVVAGNGINQGQAGRPGIGTPGRGNPSPTASPRALPAGSKPASPRPGSTTPQAAQTTGSALLPFEVIPSPFPSLEPLALESPIPSPAPTDAVQAIDNLQTEPVTKQKKASWLPLIALVLGAATLFVYFKGRTRRRARARNRKVGGGRF